MATFDDKKSEELDSEFIHILRLMKPYITCIMNNHYIELVRLWLEKLSDVNFEDKVLRNIYLIELGRQIEAGVFEEPFIYPPAVGDLPPYDVYLAQSEDKTDGSYPSDYIKYESLEITNEVERRYENEEKEDNIVPKLEIPPSLSTCSMENILTTGEDVCNFKTQCTLKRQEFERQQDGKPSHSYNVISTVDHNLFGNRNHYSSPILPQAGDRVNPRKKQEDDSSWYDLTETTHRTVGYSNERNNIDYNSGDADQQNYPRQYYEDRISKLLGVIDDLKQENLNLRESMEKCQKDLNLRNTKAETSIHALNNEVAMLKKRLQELIDIKLALQNSQFALSNEWRSNMSGVQNKLQDTLKKNLEMRSVIIILERKLRELVKVKNYKTSAIKKKLSSIHRKEISTIKDLHATAVKEMRETSMEQFQNQISALRAEYEKELKYKESEIQRLEVLMRDQCKRMQHEVQVIKSEVARDSLGITDNTLNEQKIQFLQKCIVKLEKLFNKSEKDYIKQITKLRNEMELKERTNKLLLSQQKAEIITSVSTSHQTEIDNIVTTLEQQYQELLKQQQEQALVDRKEDKEIIEQLRQEILDLQNKKNCI